KEIKSISFLIQYVKEHLMLTFYTTSFPEGGEAIRRKPFGKKGKKGREGKETTETIETTEETEATKK
ncbi:hypothetical protein, partial [Bacteroides caccae]|uniref:hypothetical protein n=1 Tax=Bacteroides caccae TaxID=47678 RepID=UPI0035657AA6